jgi:ATP-dependent helicase HrpB
LALAYPERVAKARGPLGEYQLVGGRGAYLNPTDALAREPWLAVGELGAADTKDRILLAAPLDEARVLAAFADQITEEDRLEPGPTGKMRAKRLRRLGKIVIEERLIERPDPAMIAAALLDQVRRDGLGGLNWGEGAQALRARAAFLRAKAPDDWPDLSDQGLLARLDDWLGPLLVGRGSLGDIGSGALEQALLQLIPWDQQRRLDSAAPDRFIAPTGSRLSIDYAAEGGPRVAVRVQELFGLASHPVVAGVPLTLALLSPAHRPIQVTKDLPGFWRGSWKEVRADMRGRYPRHVWPEDPVNTAPTARAKPRGT